MNMKVCAQTKLGIGNRNPTTSVFNKPVKNETLTKVDTLTSRLSDSQVSKCKEDAGELYQVSGEALRNLELANEALTAELGIGEVERTPVELMDAIDCGSDQGARIGRCTWGIIECPNLPVRNAEPHGPKGCIFVHRCRPRPPSQATNPIPLTIPPVAPRTLNLLGSVEAAYSNLAFNNTVSELLNMIMRAATQMDNQAKYCCLARGDGGVYLRMLTRAEYKEIIWTLTVSLLILALGGLCENYGAVAAGRDVHAQVLAAVQKAQEGEKERA
ncbi:hypothetical protein BU15DRAFT_90805 [Melanogaster broomeanus]|nr:hypothetical protein BU15DRAFT_90805 [Melanogaster broomeanus]